MAAAESTKSGMRSQRVIGSNWELVISILCTKVGLRTWEKLVCFRYFMVCQVLQIARVRNQGFWMRRTRKYLMGVEVA